MCVCADLGVPACLCRLAALHYTSYQWALQCNGNATQTITQNHALESRPPARHLENKKMKNRCRALAKCINALCQHLHAA